MDAGGHVAGAKTETRQILVYCLLQDDIMHSGAHFGFR